MNRLVRALPVVAFVVGGTLGVGVFTQTQRQQNEDEAATIASHLEQEDTEQPAGIPTYQPQPVDDTPQFSAVAPPPTPQLAPRLPTTSPPPDARLLPQQATVARPQPRSLAAQPPLAPANVSTAPRTAAMSAAPPRPPRASVAAAPEMAMESTAPAPEPTAAAAAPSPAETPPSNDPFTMTKVYYATDRAMATATLHDVPDLVFSNLPLICVSLACLLLAMAAFLYPQSRRATSIAAGVSLACVVYLAFPIAALVIDGYRLARVGPSYGDQRGELELGTCEVSIPRTHTIGQIERPTMLLLQLREDANKHIIVHTVERKADEEFYADLRAQVEQAPHRNVFVFIHGYNVTFDSAVRRTAQISHDLKFEGAPICYSWPSQGGLFKYTVDETNVVWTVPHLKRFLLDVVDNSGATNVNLVAHSMGNRALTDALRQLSYELREEAHLFNEVVLAAPDIDAEIFRRDLAPAIVKTANRVSLYASAGDQALLASKQVHGYPRAGDSGRGLVVVPHVETIDVSSIDTSLLGHSYYGENNSILEDLFDVLNFSLPPERRRWLMSSQRDGLDYWVFRNVPQVASPPHEHWR